MESKNYTISLEVPKTAEEVFNCINQVSKWWSKDAVDANSGQATKFEGQCSKLNDEFIMRSGDRHYSKQRLVEVIPYRKIVWQVIDSKLNWLNKNKSEWTGTKMIFEISSSGDKTLLKFTHEGLVPEQECYVMCAPGWAFFIKEKLYNLIKNHDLKDEKLQDFKYRLTVNAPAKEAMKKISQVNLWWAKGFKGKTNKLNDEFSVSFGEDTSVNFKISEYIVDKKIVWHVSDCNLGWIKDKKEWKNTEVVWNLTEKAGKTMIDFVHMGLTPACECFESCESGWTHHIKNSLSKLIDEGKGFPE